MGRVIPVRRHALAFAGVEPRTEAGVERTGSYGYQLTPAVQSAGVTVLEGSALRAGDGGAEEP